MILVGAFAVAAKYKSDRTLAVEWWVEINTGKTKLVLIVKEKDTE